MASLLLFSLIIAVALLNICDRERRAAMTSAECAVEDEQTDAW